MKNKYGELISNVYSSFGFVRPIVDFKLTEADNGEEAARIAVFYGSTGGRRRSTWSKSACGYDATRNVQEGKWGHCIRTISPWYAY